MKRQIGLHIRLTDSLIAAAEKALRLHVPFFQCFFMRQETNTFLQFSENEISLFLRNYRDHFSHLYLHGSYWINLAATQYNGYRAFQREIALAKRLSFTHMVLHPGCANGSRNKQEGIATFAHSLNKILKYEHEIQLLIENTAHGNLNIGNDINDFKLLLEQLDHPEKISFVLDTAHAFAYGYDISTISGQDQFLQQVDTIIGLKNVSLLHLNDASKECGSYIDKHALPGEGLIGASMLQRFASHPQLISVPVLIEPPLITEEQEQIILNTLHTWFSL